ncbi:MAG: flippase-like domain-containing protein [Candidatus Diapherotrites archaeon]|nr:flippase-like domain-containing protein [Candidatus Diapherotrites archaeon]
MPPTVQWITSAVLAVLVLGLLVYMAGARETLEVILSMNVLWVVFSLVIYTPGWVLRGVRWQTILRALHARIGLKDSIRLTFIANTVNILVPAKLGELARAFGVKKKYGIPLSKGLSSLFVDRLADLIAVVLVAFLGFWLAAEAIAIPLWVEQLVIASLALALIAALGFFVFLKTNWIERALVKIPFLREKKERVHEVLGAMKGTFGTRSSIGILFISLAMWVLDSASSQAILLSANYQASWGLVAFAVMCGALTKIVPLTPGGIGIYEGTIALILSLGGVPFSVALSVAVVEHALKNVYTALGGIVFLRQMGLNLAELERSHQKPI